MKTYAVVESSVAARAAGRKRTVRTTGRAQRECVTLSDPTDCLLEAYDCVSTRAYEHFLARGPRPGGELADWLSAERELLLGFSVNVENSTQIVYALASIPGATAARLEVGVDSRWLVILAQVPRRARRGGPERHAQLRSWTCDQPRQSVKRASMRQGSARRYSAKD